MDARTDDTEVSRGKSGDDTGKVAGQRPGDSESKRCEEENFGEEGEGVSAVSAGVLGEEIWLQIRKVPARAREHEVGELFEQPDDIAEYRADEGAGSAAGLCDNSRAGASQSYGPFGGVLAGGGGARPEVSGASKEVKEVFAGGVG